jgi:4-aminobutyrate aminotransferase
MSVTEQSSLQASTQAVKDAHNEFMFPCAPPLYDDPLVLVEGRGMTVMDSDGIEYLDFFSGILTTSIGHCHPEVVQRVREQVGVLGHTSTLYLTENQTRVARRLTQMAPGQLSKSFFTNSGTEAVETAVMSSRCDMHSQVAAYWPPTSRPTLAGGHWRH